MLKLISFFPLNTQLWNLGQLGQSWCSSFISANAKTILHAVTQQPFLDKLEKKKYQFFHTLPRPSRFFLVLLSSNDDSTRQVIITLSEILQAASCCCFSLFFNNHSSPCCLPKPPISGTMLDHRAANWQDSSREEKGFVSVCFTPPQEEMSLSDRSLSARRDWQVTHTPLESTFCS